MTILYTASQKTRRRLRTVTNKSTIFDSERIDNTPANYRGGYNQNLNKIINNNTNFRIFNQIKPRDGKIAPLDNLNLNPNKWKPRVTYYFQENKGEILETSKSDGHGYGHNGMFSNRSRDKRYMFSKRKL